jgi:hypothetical protein
MVIPSPTPTFGLGLIEQIPDSAILANQAAHSSRKNFFGIVGRPNRNGNDGTITRFGWKAQNKSLRTFAADGGRAVWQSPGAPGLKTVWDGVRVHGHGLTVQPRAMIARVR